MLNVQYLGSCITTELVRYQMECAYDRCLPDFFAFVDLARDVLQSIYKTSPARVPKATFIFDSSLVVSPTATKSRNRDARRRAIGLMLAYPRREGFWDSTTATGFAIWLIKKEEKGIPSGHILEAAQLRIVRTYLRLDERKAIIVCSKLIEGTEKREELLEATVSWSVDVRYVECSLLRRGKEAGNISSRHLRTESYRPKLSLFNQKLHDF